MNLITYNTPDILPCVVLGTGVAGHAAMVWLHSFGVSATWLGHTSRLGGMLRRVHNPLSNVPGTHYPHGSALADALHDQLERSSLPTPIAAHVLQIRDCGAHFELVLEDRPPLLARTVLLATGTRYGTLSFAGQLNHSSHVSTTDSAYFSASAAHDGVRFASKSVAVVGGGDAAFENALTLAEKHGCTVHLLMRSPPKARRKFIAKVIAQHAKIRVWPIPSTITHVKEYDAHIALHLDSKGASAQLDVACVFVRIGVRPVLPYLVDFALDVNDAGYVKVDDAQRTSHPRIFAAGDISHTAMQSIVTSASESAKAALSIAEELGAYAISHDELARLINHTP